MLSHRSSCFYSTLRLYSLQLLLTLICSADKYVSTFSKPTCEHPQLDTKKETITIECSTVHIDLPPQCLFKWEKLNTDTNEKVVNFINETIEYKLLNLKTDSSVDTQLFLSNCSLTVDIEMLGVGTHRFLVNMFFEEFFNPDLNLSLYDDSLKLSGLSDFTDPINLFLPEVIVSQSCKERLKTISLDSLLQNGMFECTCKIAKQGIPPGVPHWFDHSGGYPQERVYGKSYTVMAIDPNRLKCEDIYHCAAISTLGKSDVQYIQRCLTPVLNVGLARSEPDDGDNNHEIQPFPIMYKVILGVLLIIVLVSMVGFFIGAGIKFFTRYTSKREETQQEGDISSPSLSTTSYDSARL